MIGSDNNNPGPLLATSRGPEEPKVGYPFSQMLTPIAAMVVGEMALSLENSIWPLFSQKEVVSLWILVIFEVQIPQWINDKNDSEFPLLSMDLLQIGFYL